MLGGIRYRHRVVEKNHHPVAGEVFQSSLVFKNQFPHSRVILVQHAHDFFRLSGFSEGSESPEIQIDHRYLSTMRFERVLGVARHNQLGKLRREESFQSPEPFELCDLLLNALFKSLIPLLQLVAEQNLLVAQVFFFKTRANAGSQ